MNSARCLRSGNLTPVNRHFNGLTLFNLSAGMAKFNPGGTDFSFEIEGFGAFIKHINAPAFLSVGAEACKLVITRCWPGFCFSFNGYTHVSAAVRLVLIKQRQGILRRIIPVRITNVWLRHKMIPLSIA